MAGRGSRNRSRLTASCCAALLLIAGCGPGRGRSAAGHAGVLTTTATATATAPTTPASARSTPAPAPSTRHATTAQHITGRVRPSAPTGLSAPAIGLHVGHDPQSVVGTVASSRLGGEWTITPPEATWRDLQSAYWWSEQRYSALPGEPSSGTTFLYLHACLHVTCAGNRLHELRPGNTIMLATRTGVLRYTVRRTLRLDKSPQGVGNSAALYSYGRPGQLRLVTCGYAADGTSPYNWAVLATLDA